MDALIPPDELRRLEALARYSDLTSLPQEAFARLATLAAQLFRVPIALVNFVAEDSTLSQACVGIDLTRLDRQVSFCAHAILQADVMVVPDARLDPRFADNPLVGAAGGFRFYAGAPLTTADGHNIGTLCVLDTAPRAEVTATEQEALRNLAALAVDELELRRQSAVLEREALARDQLLAELRRVTRHAEALLAISSLVDLDLLPGELARHAAEQVVPLCGLDWAGLGVLQGEELQVLPVWQAPGLPPELPPLLARPLPRGRGATWAVLERGEARFIDNYPSLSTARPELVAAGVCGAAWIPLGTFPGGGPDGDGETDVRYVLVAVRTRPASPWSAADRALLETAGRSVAGGLHRRAHLDSVQRDAVRDPVTGVHNRRAFEQALTVRIAAGTPFALTVLDLDGFKAVNDSLGHVQGDILLRMFGQTLLAGVTPGGQTYRLGGDEFAVLLEIDREEDRLLVEDQALEPVDQAVAAVRGAGFNLIGASVGLALWPHDASSGKALLHLADQRMYAHKRRRAGRQATSPTPGTRTPALS